MECNFNRSIAELIQGLSATYLPLAMDGRVDVSGG